MANLQVYKVYNQEEVDEIFSVVSAIDAPRWIQRLSLQPGRAVDNAGCSYDYCNHTQMAKETREFLKHRAPRYDDFFLSEIAVNRYNPDDYIGCHRDRHDFRRNVVVSLQTGNDGLYIDDTGEFIKDHAGQGVLIEGIGPAHSVPPVNKTRYSLIFLYE